MSMKSFNEWVDNSSQATKLDGQITESMKYHLLNCVSLAESIYRPGSEAHYSLLRETRELYDQGLLELEGTDKILFEETDLGRFGEYEGQEVPLDFVFEAEYKGREVELNYPTRGGRKKYHVYVRDSESGKVRHIEFGDAKGGLKARVSNPAARKSFAARHQCHLKKDRLSAGYWACRINRYGHLWGGKTYPGYW
jgi:hypothetical protein